jgi:hypothetical protein
MGRWDDENLERETRVGGQVTSARASGRPSGPPSAPQVAPKPVEEHPLTAFDASMLEATDSEEIKGLITRCMDGTEPLPRPLHPFEMRKFSPQAVNVVLMKVAGFKTGEIVEMTELHPVSIRSYVKHPYGQKILQALLPKAVVAALDMRTRFKGWAANLAERIYSVGMTTEDENVAARITFGMMDRAGWGPSQEIKHRHGASASLVSSAKSIDRLTAALDASRRVDEIVSVDYKIIEGPSAGLLASGSAGSGTSGESRGEGVSVTQADSQAGQPLRVVSGG